MKHSVIKQLLLCFVFIGIVFHSCKEAKKKTDLLIYNATVYTVDSSFRVIDAFVVHDGLIIETGSADELNQKYIFDEVIDLAGKVIIPGFSDGHCHFYGYAGNISRYIDLSGTNSFDEVIERIKSGRIPKAEWILGRGWDQNNWEDKDLPDNKLLDSIFPDVPILLIRIDGHAVLASSKALQIGGFNANTRIEGGIVQVSAGNCTGILLDKAADSLRNVVPKPSDEQMTHALLEAQKELFGYGLTSVCDAGLKKDEIELIDSLHKTGLLKLRVNVLMECKADEIGTPGYSLSNDSLLNVFGYKLYADGALGSRGAKLLEPYSDDSGNNGIATISDEELKLYAQKVFDYGGQLCVHAIGDSANRLVLRAYASVLNGKNDRRWRVEHAQVIHPDDFNYFKDYSIIPSVQTVHAVSDCGWAENRLGSERIKTSYAYRQLINENGWLINGTDFPVESPSPLINFYAANVRKSIAGFPENGFQLKDSLSRIEALKSLTIWPAKGCFADNYCGSIEAGKVADFVVLSEDPMSCNTQSILKINILQVFVSGEEVFCNSK